MERSTLLRFMLPLIGLLLAIGALRISGTIDRQPLDADLTLSIADVCQYNTKGFPLNVTEQAVPIEGHACPAAEALTASNMMFNWVFYSVVLVFASVLLRPPAWMRRNEALKLAGYSASLLGLGVAGMFGWGMSVVLL